MVFHENQYQIHISTLKKTAENDPDEDSIIKLYNYKLFSLYSNNKNMFGDFGLVFIVFHLDEPEKSGKIVVRKNNKVVGNTSFYPILTKAAPVHYITREDFMKYVIFIKTLATTGDFS